MGILWTIFKAIFSPPRLPDTAIPDDWPPDGSLHFIECGDISWKAIPRAYRNYEFSPNEDEYDGRIPKLSIEIMERFCGSRQILTQVHSNAELPKKGGHLPECFPMRYCHFLEHMGSHISFDAPDEKTLLLLTEGFDATAFWGSQDISTTDACFFDFYAFPKECAFTDAKSAVQAVDAGKYDVWFNLSEWGPCALYITLDPTTVDANAMQGMIESICKEHQILFQNP